MYLFLFIIGILVCVGALFATISAGKEVDSTIKNRKEGKEENGLSNSEAYGNRPLGNIPTLLLIYGISFFAGILVLVLCIILFF